MICIQHKQIIQHISTYNNISPVTFQSTMRMCCSMWVISSQEVFQNRRWVYCVALIIFYNKHCRHWHLKRLHDLKRPCLDDESILRTSILEDPVFGDFYQEFRIKAESVPLLPWRWRWADVRVTLSRLGLLNSRGFLSHFSVPFGLAQFK